MNERDELVSVRVIREDLRLLLLAADVYRKDRVAAGHPRGARLDLAMERIGGTANSAEWQPKRGEADK
jgi:hypothetical protein